MCHNDCSTFDKRALKCALQEARSAAARACEAAKSAEYSAHKAAELAKAAEEAACRAEKAAGVAKSAAACAEAAYEKIRCMVNDYANNARNCGCAADEVRYHHPYEDDCDC